MDKRSAAELLNRQAVQLQSIGQARESLACFQRAARLFHELGDVQGEGRCLNGEGALFKDLGEPQAAVGALEKALTLRRKAGDIRGEAITLTTLGPAYQSLGRSEEARQVLEQALALTRRAGDRAREGQAVFNLAEIAFRVGNSQMAIPGFKQALAIAREVGDPYEEIKCLSLLGQACSQAGLLQDGFRFCRQSLEAGMNHRNPIAISCGLHGLGLLYFHLGRPEEALEHLEKSLEFDRLAGATAISPATLAAIARLCTDHPHLGPRAEACLAEGIELARRSGDHAKLVTILQIQGYVAVQLGRLEEAREHLEEALRMARDSRDPVREGECLSTLGAMHHRAGRIEEAASCQRQALALLQTAGHRPGEARELYNLAVLQDERGEHEKALQLFEAAVQLFDHLRLETGEDAHRTSFTDKHEVQNAYMVYASRLVEAFRRTSDTSYVERAFHINERRHARTLMDSLLSRRLAGGSPGGERTLEPWREAFSHFEPLTAREARERLLDNETALLAYSLQLDRSFLWLLTADACEVFQLPGGRELRRMVEELRKAVGRQDAAEHRRTAHSLYRAILEPARTRIVGKRLIVASDDALLAVPFQLLVTDPGEGDGFQDMRYLVESHEILYTPSASVLAFLRSAAETRTGSPPQDLIAFAPVEFPAGGDLRCGSLPATADEVESLRPLFPSGRVRILSGRDARKSEAVSGALRDYRFVHFATHGLLDVVNPDRSAVALRGEDGSLDLLQGSEIADLDLRADLVVLSACQTGLGSVGRGEGILGLTRACFYAGARAVCASLWSVGDRSTAELMRRFYSKLVRDGREPAAALREAQLEMLRGEPAGDSTHRDVRSGPDRVPWSSPFAWAPFIVIGG